MVFGKDIGCERFYNREFAARGIDNVVSWDIFPVADKEVIRIVFESCDSERRQGIWLRTDKGIDVEGQHGKSIVLWYDTSPGEVFCTCYTNDGCLSVYNKYVNERGQVMSQAAGTGMLIEDIPNGRRYMCNDTGFDTDFRRLVFRIERVGEDVTGDV